MSIQILKNGARPTERHLERQFDLLRAHEELARRSQAGRFTWLAARLGATLALQAARHAQGLRRLVLWEPILEGRAYIEELLAAHIDMLEVGFYDKDPAWYARSEGDDGPEITEALGHRISSQLAAQLKGLRPTTLSAPAAIETQVFFRQEQAPTLEWCKRESAQGRKVTHETLDHPIIWTADPLPNQAIVPGDVTKRLIETIR